LEPLKPCVARLTGTQPTLVDALPTLTDDREMRTALDGAEETLDEHERDFIGNIREHGWFRTSVSGDGGNDFPPVQMVWPDREGRFPWDSEFDAGFKDNQPDLSVLGWDRVPRWI
jgi:hypothetical protein